MGQQIAVVIPVYCEKLLPEERFSLEQCLRVLGSHSIFLIGAMSFDFEKFLQENQLSSDLPIERFSDRYFEGIKGYNCLMLSESFYARFAAFEYLLVHQLDAFVFRDELLEWARASYDYIGGLWFRGFGEKEQSAHLYLPGNGGLSLRRVDSVRKLLRSRPRLRDRKWLARRFLGGKFSWWIRLRQRILFPLRLLGWRNRIGDEKWVGRINEDIFFAEVAPRRKRFFKVPNVEEASYFSWDRDPKSLFERLGSLPFGCHGWWRNDGIYRGNREFWSEKVGWISDRIGSK